MLQINMQNYASDALEDAMRLAQTKALNSYSFSDCLNYLNYAWMDMYQQIAFVDEGFYSKTIRLTKKLTKLPAYVKNSLKVYATQIGNQYNREIFRESGMNDLQAWNTFHISGWDLYCPDAERRTVYLNYLPQQPQIFFTRDNRDPKLLESIPAYNNTMLYNMWQIAREGGPDANKHYVAYGSPSDMSRITMKYRNTAAGIKDIDASVIFAPAHGFAGTYQPVAPEWHIVRLFCDYPYIFITYKHNITGEWWSGFYANMPDSNEFIEFNPFAFTGRNSQVEYIDCKWNDKTGLGATIIDHNDQDRVKYIGWTPDTLLHYPTPEMYRLLVARLADKFSALNESEPMAVAKELAEAEYAFKNFVGKDKAAWRRIDNVNGPNIGDWL